MFVVPCCISSNDLILLKIYFFIYEINHNDMTLNKCINVKQV